MIVKKSLWILLVLVLILGTVGCGGADNSSPAFNEIKDNNTGKIYSLGTAKSIFDEAFGEPDDSYDFGGYNNNEYLNGALTVGYKNDVAARIEAEGPSSRFSFQGFNFNMDIKSIEKGS